LNGEGLTGMAAEKKPDFSGEYVLNAQTSALAGGAAAVRSAVLRFEHREPIVRCEGAFNFDETSVNYTLELFGRRLSGTPDALPGFELGALKIDDETVVAISGQTHHTMATFTGRASDVISGTVFTLTPDEIQNADKYEVTAVKRVAVVLQSGVRAWAYVDARYAPPPS
jgi:hypothetical protein